MLSNTMIEKLQRAVPDWMQTAVIPGASLAIVARDTVWQKQWGIMSSQTNQPVTAQTAFQAASLSKPVFAYAVLQLVVAGQLDLNTPLFSYLSPDRQTGDYLFDHVLNEPNLQKITARHILSHRPGFPNWAAKGTKLKTFFTPGKRFSYSGEGYIYLQRVLAHILQQDVHDWVRTTTLKPLNMRQASFTASPDEDSHIAVGHDETGQAVDFWEMSEMGSAYSLHCTAVDYAHFLAEMLRQSPITSLMLTAQTQVNDSASNDEDWPSLNAPLDPKVGWGLGWGLQTGENGRFFWHWGDNGTYKAFAAGQPETGTAVVI